MRPSEIKEQSDKYIAWTVTFIVHAAILVALLFVAAPKQDNTTSAGSMYSAPKEYIHPPKA